MFIILEQLEKALRIFKEYVDKKIPKKISDLTNDSNFITSADIPAVVVPDWNSTSSQDGYIQNKPDLKAGAGTNSVQNQNSSALGENAFAFGSVNNSIDVDLTGEANAVTYNYDVIDGELLKSMVDSGNLYIVIDQANNSIAKITAITSDSEDFNSGTLTVDKTLSATAISEQNYIINCFNKATGKGSFSEGSGTASSGEGSHSEGVYTIASDEGAHAEGKGSIASGLFTHAEGYGTKATQQEAHAEGQQSTASGWASHAEGHRTTAFGDYSHTEGHYTQATNECAHAEGSGTIASGTYSHAEGNATISNHKSQHVSGEYNVEDPSTKISTKRGNYVEIVGNGTAENARSNARTLDWRGNEWIRGNLKVGGSSYDDPNAKELATKEYVDAAIAQFRTLIAE